MIEPANELQELFPFCPTVTNGQIYIKSPIPFNPLDRSNLIESIENALLKSPLVPMNGIETFSGAGIYAIYYTGTFASYSKISNSGIPIYVGKAVPEGSRKGVLSRTGMETTKLAARLREHGNSISSTTALEINDFVCRYLIVDDMWITFCETSLIQRSLPLWNTVLDGFGRHVSGKNRKDGISPWHIFHEGRDFNSKNSHKNLIIELENKVKEYMESLPKSIK